MIDPAWIANLALLTTAVVGGFTAWRSRKRERTEDTGLSQEMWFKEFGRLEKRATQADERADAAEQRADANEAALREARREFEAMAFRIDEMERELAQLRLREKVLADALEAAGIPVNGWVETAMRDLAANLDNPQE